MKLTKCIKCHSTDTVDEIISDDNRIEYRCCICGHLSPKAIFIDSRFKVGLTDKNELFHFSVGIVIMNESQEVLLVRRRLFDFTWSTLFGHTHSGETARDAAIRELAEETGINKSNKLKFCFKKLIETSCRTDVKTHDCSVFQIQVPNATPIIINRESEAFIWVSANKLHLYHPFSNSTNLIFKDLQLV